MQATNDDLHRLSVEVDGRRVLECDALSVTIEPDCDSEILQAYAGSREVVEVLYPRIAVKAELPAQSHNVDSLPWWWPLSPVWRSGRAEPFPVPSRCASRPCQRHANGRAPKRSEGAPKSAGREAYSRCARRPGNEEQLILRDGGGKDGLRAVRPDDPRAPGAAAITC